MSLLNLRLGIVLLVLIAEFSVYEASKDWSADTKPEKWYSYSKTKINELLNRRLNGNLAKNVILFLGDGMGISTVTAGRILKGQYKDNNGEEEITAMESLDHIALSKTYNIDAQTADSAGTATAYLCGVKTRIGAIGVDGTAVDCKTTLSGKVESILKWAYYAGKSTGIVTTTRVTHATPAGSYASVADRDWEAYDDSNFGADLKSQGCKDIAAQLVEDNSFINVILAGGRRKFYPKNETSIFNRTGDRTDNRNLFNEWEDKMKSKGLKHKFLWNLTDFNSLKANQYEHVLGLLGHDHLSYEIERDNKSEPSIIELTAKAIELLSTNPKGYFLLVEGGRIDHGHHDGKAQKALSDFVAFDGAIDEALHRTSVDDTLIVVTADHSHVFTMGGYSNRGNDLFDINNAKESALTTDKKLTYTPLIYGNGPGGIRQIRTKNLTREETMDVNYQQEAAVYLDYETHGGEDVAIYAHGPMSYLFDGTLEQSHIAHVMAYSACIGPYNSTKYPNCEGERGVYFKTLNNSNRLTSSSALLIFISIFSIFKKF